MPVDQIAQDWAPVASAGLAAIAAAAAWGNVRQSRRQWLMTQRPVMVPQVVDNAAEARMELHILNAGPGPARSVRFCLALGPEFSSGYAGPNLGGLLKSDETQVVRTQLSTRSGRARCIVTCVDNVDRVHAFDLDGRHAILRWRDQDNLDPKVLFREWFPDVDLGRFTRVGGSVQRKSGGSG